MKTNHSKPATQRFSRILTAVIFLLALTPVFLAAQTAIDEDTPWPRVRSTNGSTVTLYLPQVDSWTSNSFVAHSVVEVKPANAKKELLGVVWLEAHGIVDRDNRIVNLDHFEITRASFPDAPDGGSNALAVVRAVVPAGARVVSLDYLITALGFEQAAARQNGQELNHTPPEIIWTTNRAVLVIIDGDPVLRPVPDSTLERVINTPALIVRDKTAGKFYLSGDDHWFAADSIKGPWAFVQVPPATVATLSPPGTNSSAPRTGEPMPQIIVSTRPAELLLTDGMPNFTTVRSTSLQSAANSDSQLFYYSRERTAYLLLSGRWFKAASLAGPWTYLAPRDLPDEFAKIPPTTPQGAVLASVPGTPQAELALVADSVPTTATVSRSATIEVTYDGEPQFKPIEDTAMSYAVNAQLPVIKSGDNYFAVDNGVWFTAASSAGPWAVAAEVPEEIYTIPPSSPMYYATFARVYDSDTNSVEVGYTPGYTGTYEDDGTSVYGTGYDYEPWCGHTYYGWGWSWGYGYTYYPWYGWWTWRPWWNGRNGLRAALIDNVYDRWQTGIVTPHDRVAGAAARASQWRGYSGYPALYGRFSGATRPVAMTPPADTVAINPYSRPQTRAHAGEIPKGAQLLTAVRQSPGGGRDLYALPDGNIYQRRSDGWYRSQGAGKWNYYAPARGTLDRSQQVGQTRGGQPASAGDVYRINAARNTAAANQMRANQAANAAAQARARDIAALDRQYYARSLGQARAQNVRQNNNRSAPARAVRGGGRSR